MGEQSIQGKSTQISGLKKDVAKTVLKDGEYHHVKNAVASSIDGDMPYIQNAPSNLECLKLPIGFNLLGEKYIKEKNFHVIFLVNDSSTKSEIGYFYPDECRYESIIKEDCLGFNQNYPIKAVYQYIECDLHIYFQDGFNRDRQINMSDLPYKKFYDSESDCYKKGDTFDCDAINIQNSLSPPIVEVDKVEENGGLRAGAYQFKIAYANINGNEQSSYYSSTNIVPIFSDPLQGYEKIQGSKANVLTTKSISVKFSNLDTKFDYINLAVIKTTEGTPTYELVATLPISAKEYSYTGREITKLLDVNRVIGLYPDYYNSKTLTSANNYLIRANMSTQDEANYQRLANLLNLEWVAIRKDADTFDGSYKNPLSTTNHLGYQRGEVVPFGVRFLLTNGRKTATYHISSREAINSDLITYTSADAANCDLYEFSDAKTCEEFPKELKEWQIYDTSSITERLDETNLDKCDSDVVAYGDFAYWESTDRYPCNEEVWGNLAGKPIRHHKFPSANTFYIHNSPYSWSTSGAEYAFERSDSFIYPMGIRLKQTMRDYIQQAYSFGILSQEELDLIAGYEIVRGDRVGQKSIIANGLLYNMRYYEETNPSTNTSEKIQFPNYPFNDLRPDPFLRFEDKGESFTEPINIPQGTGSGIYASGYVVQASNGDAWANPYPVTFTIPSNITTNDDFYVIYSYFTEPYTSNTIYAMTFNFLSGDPDLEQIVIYNSIWTDTDLVQANYEKDTFTFHSPDTHFKSPFLGTEINVHALEYGASRSRFEKVDGHPELRPFPLSDSVNMALAFKAVSNYNNYVINPKGQQRRFLEDKGYLIGNNFTRISGTSQKINNRFRESSVGLKLSCDLDDPSIIDKSRYIVSGYVDNINPSNDSDCKCKKIIEDRKGGSKKDSFEIDPECTERYQWISSYYASLKHFIPNQYGQIDSIRYISTGKYNYLTERSPIFGGDTFITRFSLRRKHAFFTVDMIDSTSIGLTYDKKDVIPYTQYYANNEHAGAIGSYVIDKKRSHLDCGDSGYPVNGSNHCGYFYLYNTGIVNFFVESSINTELRYSGANAWETWYPVLDKLRDENEFMEQKKVNINFDNVYNYNFDYSKQNMEEALFPQAADFDPNNQCKNTHPRRIIYSKQNNSESSTDFWLVNPANNYYDADSNLGSIIDVQAIDSQKVMVRYENGSQIFNAFDTLQLESTSVTVGTGGMFSNRPQTFAETDTGYAGSSSKWAIDITQFGTFFCDYPRRKIFNFASDLDEISNQGMYNWFNENMGLKFEKVLESITGNERYNKDNPFFGVGYSSAFDNRFNLWFLTKKDYILKNPVHIVDLSIDENGTLLYKGKITRFSDDIWKECGWTISYSPQYKAWISFHSFLPNFYMDSKVNMFTGIVNKGIWKHWDNSSFQTYYGKLYPFEVMLTTSAKGGVNILHSIEYHLKTQKYVGDFYQDVIEDHNINFNKAIVSTDNQSSGLLNLIRNDKARPFEMLKYPIVNGSSVDILYSKVEGHNFRFNQFVDIVADKNNNVPIFKYDINGVDREVSNINYQKVSDLRLKNQKLRNEYFDVTLINDKESQYKFILKALLNKTLKSDR